MRKLLFVPLLLLASYAKAGFTTSNLTATATFTVVGSTLSLNGTTYYWTAGTGSSGQVLTTNGSSPATLSFTTGAGLSSTQTFTGGNAFKNGISVSTLPWNSAIFSVAASSITLAAPAYIQGTITNDSAPAGYVGEYVSSTTVNNQKFAGTDTYWDFVSIPLTPGDWDITIQCFYAAGSATVTEVTIGVGTVAGNSGTGLSDASNQTELALAAATRTSGGSLQVRKSIAVSTTF